MSSSSTGIKIRLQVKSCRDLVKRDLTQKPLPYCRIAIDGARTTVDTKCGQKSTGEYVFEQAFDLALGRTDSIIIDILDKHKITKKPNKVRFKSFIRISSQLFIVLFGITDAYSTFNIPLC